MDPIGSRPQDPLRPPTPYVQRVSERDPFDDLSREVKLALFCWGNEEDKVRALLRGTIDFDFRDEKGRTILHYAAVGGNRIILQLLVDAGMSVDVLSDEGLTPLHFAVGYAKYNAVIYLMNADANPFIKAKNGYSPLELARYRPIMQAFIDLKKERMEKMESLEDFIWCARFLIFMNQADRTPEEFTVRLEEIKEGLIKELQVGERFEEAKVIRDLKNLFHRDETLDLLYEAAVQPVPKPRGQITDYFREPA